METAFTSETNAALHRAFVGVFFESKNGTKDRLSVVTLRRMYHTPFRVWLLGTKL